MPWKETLLSVTSSLKMNEMYNKYMHPVASTDLYTNMAAVTSCENDL